MCRRELNCVPKRRLRRREITPAQQQVSEPRMVMRIVAGSGNSLTNSGKRSITPPALLQPVGQRKAMRHHLRLQLNRTARRIDRFVQPAGTHQKVAQRPVEPGGTWLDLDRTPYLLDSLLPRAAIGREMCIFDAHLGIAGSDGRGLIERLLRGAGFTGKPMRAAKREPSPRIAPIQLGGQCRRSYRSRVFVFAQQQVGSDPRTRGGTRR